MENPFIVFEFDNREGRQGKKFNVRDQKSLYVKLLTYKTPVSRSDKFDRKAKA